ncbi:tRNA lysidine(34) synthetase TilS [Aquabacter spiritensis]|uniref:tRNA(Ile)-lysidine synthase n=1 Tax=Aquabacter spiritensis TaxID=933073 RepID=A0A4R3LYZ0_9HYPH|nr:tRNA lysidine(34) synthetase TilS [Aquabacter spiritensis]TCT03947.1 tRNA(Ile)-lysidine synthase [Aquabacter spiritensis]
MRAADAQLPFGGEELDRLFLPFQCHARVLLAVSGGPDSTALLLLAHAWRAGRAAGPDLSVATVDHRLRPESAAEARSVGAVCRRLGLSHAVLDWMGEKPRSGIPAAARAARYGLLARHAASRGATALALAHTRDDQAETVLLRLARGSGLAGLAAMRPVSRMGALALVRPFLDIPKARLVAEVRRAGVDFAEDPGNRDPRFTRPRLRAIAAALAAEGLDAPRLAAFARRAARADAALATLAEEAAARCRAMRPDGTLAFDGAGFAALPEEISLRVLLDAVRAQATEGEPELGKAERLHAGLLAALGRGARFGRTLAGAQITHAAGTIRVRPAPPREKCSGSQIRRDVDTHPWQATTRHLD